MTETMKPHPTTGLYPIEMLVSEASMGLRAGEVRGFNETVAKQLIEAKQGKYVAPTVRGKGKLAKVEKA